MKHPMKNTLSALALISSGILLTGCGGSSSTSTDTGANTINVSIPFQAVAGSEKIACGENITGLGTGAGGAGNSAKIADFRMFVHGIKLITDQGLKIPVSLDASQPSQNSDVVLLDFRDKAELDNEGKVTAICVSGTAANPHYNDTVKGSVTVDPAYTISHVEFTLGVPFELNHADQTKAAEPLRNPGLATGMHWNWQGGYKFTAFDVLPTGGIIRPSNNAWSSSKWNLHVGSTGCSVSPSDLGNGIEPEVCSAPNKSIIRLAIGTNDLDDIAIKLDYAALVSDSNLSEDGNNAPGCMSGGSDPECEATFEKLGLPWAANEAVAQTVFSIVDRAEN